MDSYKKELAERDEDIEELRNKLDDLRNENDELKGLNSQLEIQKDSRDDEIKDLRKQLQARDAEIDKLEVFILITVYQTLLLLFFLVGNLQ